MITQQINGVSQTFERGLNVAELIQRLAIKGKKLAIEYNGELVPRAAMPSAKLPMVIA